MEYYVGLLPDGCSDTFLAEIARQISEAYPKMNGEDPVDCQVVAPRTCLICGPFVSADEREIVSVFHLMVASITSPVRLDHGRLGLFGRRYCMLLHQQGVEKLSQTCCEALKRFGLPDQLVRFPPPPVGCDRKTAEKITFLPHIDLTECSIGIFEHMCCLPASETAPLDAVLSRSSQKGIFVFDRFGLLRSVEGRQLEIVGEWSFRRRAA